MLPGPSNPPPTDDPAAPPALIAGLRTAYRRPVAVPLDIERAILTQPLHRRHPLRWAAWGTAAAAAVLALAAWLVIPHSGRPGGTPARLAGDLDADGSIDILDAFYLARQIRSGPIASGHRDWDVSGDGKIDSADVDQIAALAVRLPGGPL